MNLHEHAATSTELLALPMEAEDISEFQAMIPVTATPATIAAVGAGVAAGIGVIGAAGAGAAVGEAID